MFKTASLSLLLLTLFGAAAAAQDTQSITDAETVFAIYTEDYGLFSSVGTQLIMCVWGDGKIVWSGNQAFGGKPYFTATLDPDDVAKTLKKFDHIGVFDIPDTKRSHVGPDSLFTSILVKAEGQEMKMSSWHEVYESSGKAVAADRGLTSLNGRKLLPVLAEQDADFLHFRMTWLELRLAAAQLIPKQGEKAVGVPQMRRGKLSWQAHGEAADGER